MLDKDLSSIPFDETLYQMVIQKFRNKIVWLNDGAYLLLHKEYVRTECTKGDLLMSVENFVRMFEPILSTSGLDKNMLQEYCTQQNYGEEITKWISGL